MVKSAPTITSRRSIPPMASYDKTGSRLAAFTENQLWSGNGTICNGQSQGDPIVIYDALADRWILTHFAFGVSGADTVAPYFQCIAVSKTSDPVAGGWWLYPVRVDDATHPWLNDYAKFGIWTDCLYMSANEFTGAGSVSGNAVCIVQPRRHVCRPGVDLVDRVCRQYERSIYDDPEPLGRPVGRGGPGGNAELLCFGVADRVCVRSQKIHGGAELRRRWNPQRGDQCFPSHVHRPRYQCAAARHYESARFPRGPPDAKGAVPEDRCAGIAVGIPYLSDLGVGRDRNTVGTDQCHRRQHSDDASAAAVVQPGGYAVSLDAQPGRRRAGQRGGGLFQVEWHGAEFSKHRILRAAGGRCREYAAADGDCADRGERLADRQLWRRTLRPLGRLHGDERGPSR